MAAATWVAEISWNNDSDFSDTGEDVTARVLNEPGIVMERGRDQIRALAPPMAGRCDFSLNNASKDYSVEYASSPLYGNLLPGRPMRFRTTAPSAATLWAGNVDDIQQEPFLRGGGRVRVPGLGKLAKLKGTRVTTDFHLNDGITTSAAIVEVLTAAGLTASDYTMLDTGLTTLTAWWCAEDDAFDMLRRLLAAEGPGAAIYEQADGKIAFHSRHYRLLTSRSNTSQVTLGNSTTEPKHSLPFGFNPNLKDVVNTATVTQATLTAGEDLDTDLATVWFDEEIYLPLGASMEVEFILDNPATSVIGVGRTVPIDAAVVPHDVSLDVTEGVRFVLTITANPTAITLAGARLAGYPYTTDTQVIRHNADTSASQAKYGVRDMPSGFTPWPYITAAAARDLANSVVINYQEPRPTVTVTVANANSTRLTQQLTREISDRVTVVESQTGLNAAMYIERIRHEVREGGRFHRTTFGCEKVGAYDDYFLFDVDNFDGESFGF